MTAITRASGALLSASLGAFLALGGAALADEHGEEELTIFSGVYTEEQAERGKTVYFAECAVCHGITGRGGPGAPSITGSTFNSKYRGVPLGVYYHYMQATMPINRPGSLGDQRYIDIMAFLLQVHGAPPGEAELSVDEELLDTIMIERDPRS